jgi:hypothetical protein
MAWNGIPTALRIRMWVSIHEADLGATVSPWQIDDVPSLRSNQPLFAGAWRQGDISWIDANLVFPAVDPDDNTAADLRAHVRMQRLGNGNSQPELQYATASEVARFAGRALGQATVFDLSAGSEIPSDDTW